MLNVKIVKVNQNQNLNKIYSFKEAKKYKFIKLNRVYNNIKNKIQTKFKI